MIKWKNKNYEKIVYHGTGNPPGTVFNLKKPSLNQPLFVGEVMDIAMSYAVTDVEKEDGSIFVIELVDNPFKLSFDFKNRKHLGILGKKFPWTARIIDSCVHSGIRDRESFFQFSNDISMAATDIIDKEHSNWVYTYAQPSEFKKSLVELGMLTLKWTPGGDVECVNSKLEKIFKTIEYGSGIQARRLIKGVIYKAIYKLGFKMVVDDDTSNYVTLNRKKYGRSVSEFAILDLSVIKTGLSESIDPYKVEEVVQEKYGVLDYEK